MTEIMRQTQDPGHVATAHLSSRFAHLPIERSSLFDNQDTRFGAFAFQHEGRRRAGKRATDDHDVVIEIHRPKRMAFILLVIKRVEWRKQSCVRAKPLTQSLFRLSLDHGAGRIKFTTR